MSSRMYFCSGASMLPFVQKGVIFLWAVSTRLIYHFTQSFQALFQPSVAIFVHSVSVKELKLSKKTIKASSGPDLSAAVLRQARTWRILWPRTALLKSTAKLWITLSKILFGHVHHLNKTSDKLSKTDCKSKEPIIDPSSNFIKCPLKTHDSLKDAPPWHLPSPAPRFSTSLWGPNPEISELCNIGNSWYLHIISMHDSILKVLTSYELKLKS